MSESPETLAAGVKRAASPGDLPPGKRSADANTEEKKAKKRRKVNHACVYCRRSHMTCDQARPCSRCLKRDIGHLCHDELKDQRKSRSDGESMDADGHSPPGQNVEDASGAEQRTSNHVNVGSGSAAAAASSNVLPATTAPANLTTVDAKASGAPIFEGGNRRGSDGPPTESVTADDEAVTSDWNSHLQLQDIHNFHPQYSFNTNEAHNEYNLLNHFLSSTLLDDDTLYQGEDPGALFNDEPYNGPDGPATTGPFGVTSQSAALLGPPSRVADGSAISRPPSRLRGALDQAQETYYMTAADPAGTESPEERMNKLLKAKYDAGLLKPFNYVKGYARLNTYMETHLHPRLRQQILRQVDAFRPKFRERMQSLTDVELIRVEMWFDMKLMEYDRVFASMAIPACCWRRTGEIFRGNREMAELIGVPLERLREGKLAIHDIIGDDSLALYWTKFGQIAFDPSKKAMLASCTLKQPIRDVKDREHDMRCCFSFTVQRDEHQIPSIIIGNFLPIEPLEAC